MLDVFLVGARGVFGDDAEGDQVELVVSQHGEYLIGRGRVCV